MTRAPDAFDSLFRASTGFAPYPWQRKLALRPEPAGVIAAPTGSGKTEAVLLDWLWRRPFCADAATRAQTPLRLLIALPMRTLGFGAGVARPSRISRSIVRSPTGTIRATAPPRSVTTASSPPRTRSIRRSELRPKARE